MAIQIELRRGSAAQNAVFTGVEGEVTYSTDEKRLITHDGSTVGGTKQATKAEVDSKEASLGFTPENVANKSTDGTLAANSTTLYPSQSAVKTYADTKQTALGFTPENVANKSTDGTLAANSTTLYPSQSAVRTYVAAAIMTLPYRAISGTDTFTATDYTVDCTSGTFTLNLPTAVGITGRIYVAKNSGIGTITLDPAGAELIDSLATATIVSGAPLTVQSNNVGWIII